MNYFNQINEIEEKEVLPGFHGRMLHLAGFTIAYWRIEKGSILPAHAHIHEQLSQVTSGEFEMTVDGETQICVAGKVVTIPSQVVHSGKALTDCTIIDVFQPVREDYK
ncbi:MAG: cupin domain-containing protein [Bacteroidota bacterium]